MKYIPLTRGYEAQVDDEDYAYLSQFKWCALVQGRNVYAQRRITFGYKKSRCVTMHLFLLGKKDGLLIDHIDRNGLNNQRSNLRFTTKALNAVNRGAGRNNKAGIKGISWASRDKRWRSSVTVNGKNFYGGSFLTKEEAIRSYEILFDKHYGQMAVQ